MTNCFGIWKLATVPQAVSLAAFGGAELRKMCIRDSYCTVYISGYGTDQPSARHNWGIALKLVGNATLQLSRVD